MDRYEGPLLAYAIRLLAGDVDRARDLVQDVFLRLVRADRSAIGERMSAWLFRVCRNRARDLQAREKPMRELDVDETPLDTAAGPLESLEAQDDATRIRTAVARLPERERELLHLKFQHGLSYEEMGEVTGLTATNVGFLLHKALRSLRELLPDAAGSARRECAS